MPRPIAALLLVPLLAVPLACSDGGDDEPTGAPVTSATPADPATTPVTFGDVAVPEVAAGRAVLRLADETESLELEVTDCGISPDVPVDAAPVTQVLVDAVGVDGSGRPVRVEVRRFAQAGAAYTITDTVTLLVGDPDVPDRALQAQRFEVDGVVTDTRDPEASEPLLVVGGDGARAVGVFGPPGAFADDVGLVQGFVVATCP